MASIEQQQKNDNDGSGGVNGDGGGGGDGDGDDDNNTKSKVLEWDEPGKWKREASLSHYIQFVYYMNVYEEKKNHRRVFVSFEWRFL